MKVRLVCCPWHQGQHLSSLTTGHTSPFVIGRTPANHLIGLIESQSTLEEVSSVTTEAEVASAEALVAVQDRDFPHPNDYSLCIPLPRVPVGGRLAHFSAQWEHLPSPDWSLKIIREGLKLSFLALPPLSLAPIPVQLPHNKERREVLLQEFQLLVEKGALERVVDGGPGFYAHLFTVPKRTGGFRPVTDLKVLNRFVRCPTFKMESDLKVRSQLRVGEWMTSVDLSDAYLHVPVHRDYRKYMRIHVQGQTWQYRAMCFGLCTAPRIFTKLLQPVAAFLRERGIVIHRYLDDWLVRAPSYQQSRESTQIVIETLTRLGWLVNLKKSELQPTQHLVFLGMDINLATGILCPTKEKCLKIQAWVEFLHSVSKLTVRQYLSLLGLLNHVAYLIPLGRLHVRPLQMYLASFSFEIRSQLDTFLPLKRGFYLALQWWEDQSHLRVGVPLSPPPPSLTLFTDASQSAWGASTLEDSAKGQWDPAERKLHISVLELRAVKYGLQALESKVQRRTVRLMSDNVSAVAYLRNQGGTRSVPLYKEVRDLLLWCQSHQTELLPTFIPGKRNVIADQLSRPHQVLQTEWALCPHVFGLLLRAIPSLEVDLFATRWNAKLPRFVSPYPDPRAWETDALSIPWEGLIGYAFPPTAILGEVIDKIHREDCQILLIAPYWPGQPWYPHLLHLLIDYPIQLPPNRRLLSQNDHIYYKGLDRLKLHAFWLSRKNWLRKDFLSRLQLEQRVGHKRSHHFDYTNLTFGHTWIGVIHGISITNLQMYRT